jgi:hypothetical protein
MVLKCLDNISMMKFAVCCHIHGFHPYVYLPAPAGIDKTNLAVFRKVINKSVFRTRIRIQIHRIHMFLGLPDPDPLVRGMDPDPTPDPDPSVIKQK